MKLACLIYLAFLILTSFFLCAQTELENKHGNNLLQNAKIERFIVLDDEFIRLFKKVKFSDPDFGEAALKKEIAFTDHYPELLPDKK